MPFHYVWLIWSSAFLLPWTVLYVANPDMRRVMWRASLATAVFGLTEPLFVPEYWNPPSLFDLAQRTGFDLESLIFSFAIGGVGVVLYNTVTRSRVISVPVSGRISSRHRWHRAALLLPPATFVPLALLPWNRIYAAIGALLIGSAASVICRPRLIRKTLLGGLLFLGLYAVFAWGLEWLVPGYIASVWNLADLSGVLLGAVPLEELLFAAAFGMYWSGIYEHLTWTESTEPTAWARGG